MLVNDDWEFIRRFMLRNIVEQRVRLEQWLLIRVEGLGIPKMDRRFWGEKEVCREGSYRLC